MFSTWSLQKCVQESSDECHDKCTNRKCPQYPTNIILKMIKKMGISKLCSSGKFHEKYTVKNSRYTTGYLIAKCNK